MCQVNGHGQEKTLAMLLKSELNAPVRKYFQRLPVQFLMFGVVEPATDPRRVGEWDQDSAVLLFVGANDILQARSAVKGLDRHCPYQQNDLWLHQAYLRV